MKPLSSFQKVSLGIFPTPVRKLDNISELLNTNVYIKRDDLTGLGLGGNKVRKLEYLLADARQKRAQVVFTTGGAQSNHAMLTAAAANKLGMKPILILKKRGVTECLGNQLLEALMGADLQEIIDDYMLSFYNYYGINKETEPARYEAVLNNNLIPMLCHVTGADSYETLEQMDLKSAVTNYLIRNGMAETDILALTEKLR